MLSKQNIWKSKTLDVLQATAPVVPSAATGCPHMRGVSPRRFRGSTWTIDAKQVSFDVIECSNKNNKHVPDSGLIWSIYIASLYIYIWVSLYHLLLILFRILPGCTTHESSCCIQKNIEKRIEPEIAMINTEENEGGQKLLYQLLGLWAN